MRSACRRMSALSLVSALFLAGCSNDVAPSALTANGPPVLNPNKQPIVEIRIKSSICSGTIINSTPQVSTAFHCFDFRNDLPLSDIVINVGGTWVHPIYYKGHGKEQHDMAILTLPAGTKIPGYYPIKTDCPPGEKVWVSGFGSSEHEAGDAGVLRGGWNENGCTSEDGFLKVDGPQGQTTSSQTTARPGDSGGGLITPGGETIGSVQGGTGFLSDDGIEENKFVDFNDPENKEFIAQATDPQSDPDFLNSDGFQNGPPPLADDDNDGVPNTVDRCSQSPAGKTVHKSGEWAGCAGGQTRN